MPSKSSGSCFKSNDAFPMPQPHAQFAYAPRTVPMVKHRLIYGGLYLVLCKLNYVVFCVLKTSF
jgi:hypothetical protein